METHNILSSVTRVANTNLGYAVTTITHEETGTKITSSVNTYTVESLSQAKDSLYNKTAGLEHDSTPRYVNTHA